MLPEKMSVDHKEMFDTADRFIRWARRAEWFGLERVAKAYYMASGCINSVVQAQLQEDQTKPHMVGCGLSGNHEGLCSGFGDASSVELLDACLKKIDEDLGLKSQSKVKKVRNVKRNSAAKPSRRKAKRTRT
jgi:hypothetical protein